MSTIRQIEANRRNAQQSTGPTSVTGKAVSSMNALKTGIHAKSLVLPSEHLADLEQLIDEHYHRHLPSSPEARDFVDDLIYCEWTLRRLRAADTQMWRYQSDDRFRDPQKYPLGYAASCNPGTFTKLQYRLDATRRARVRALQALEKLKTEAEAAPAPTPVVEPALSAIVPPSLNPSPQTTATQIGFVPATPVTAPGVSPAPPNPGPNRPVPVVTSYDRIR